MVVDASGISLASDLIHLIDSAFVLIGHAGFLHGPVQAFSVQAPDLELVTSQLQLMSVKISEDANSVQLHSDETPLQKLAVSAPSISNELLKEIDGLKVHVGPHQTWRNSQQAWKAVMKEDKVQKQKVRLEILRHELHIQASIIIKNRQNSMSKVVDHLLQDAASMEISSEHELKDIYKQLAAMCLSQSPDNLKVELEECHRSLTESIEASSRIKHEMQFLESLKFASMPGRYSDITEAHVTTFNWIYCPSELGENHPGSQIKFARWLEQDDGIFWISGKAGSGKSTLMKFLCDNQQTLSALFRWAGPRKLVVARFFFWNAGTLMQKSLNGLLQSLLHEILRQCPYLMPRLCRERWGSSRVDTIMSNEWSFAELFSAFMKLHDQQLVDHKFVFFIDGLDEFEGDHNELVKVFQGMALNIKLCVSSRPWACFEDAFGANPQRKLNLQDLTRDDIVSYAKDNLDSYVSDYQWTMTADEVLEYQRFIREISDRAQGAFLWARLVVDNLRQDFVNRDSITTLQKSLRSIPTDLEGLYQHLLHSLSEVPATVVPFQRNPDFVDRGDLLEKIDERCSRLACTAALVGQGGVGKSQLAIEYAYRTQARSPDTSIFWVDASNIDRLKHSFGHIVDMSNIAGQEDPHANILESIREWFQKSEKNWLLIFDNVDDATFFVDVQLTNQRQLGDSERQTSPMIYQYLPHGQKVSILVTTRSHEAALKLVQKNDIIPVNPMDEANAVQLLNRKLKSRLVKNNKDDAELVAALEFLPLAIVQAAVHISQLAPRYSVRQYIEDFQKANRKISSFQNEEAGHRPEASEQLESWKQRFVPSLNQSEPDSGYVSASRPETSVETPEPAIQEDNLGSHVIDKGDRTRVSGDYDIQSLATEIDDSGSQVSHETTRAELTGQTLLGIFLAEDSRFRELCEKALIRLDRQRFVENLQRLFRSFHKNLLTESESEAEKAVARLLRRRRERLHISQRLIVRLEQERDIAKQDENIDFEIATEDKRCLESWIINVSEAPADLPEEKFEDPGLGDEFSEPQAHDEFPFTSELRRTSVNSQELHLDVTGTGPFIDELGQSLGGGQLKSEMELVALGGAKTDSLGR
ncbi:MAG: hypothetical protein M1821_001763 [Bathelium mastoideum]|nr:MAG: hypothetical protein M1821_001763 [Bathelium mastoideum]